MEHALTRLLASTFAPAARGGRHPADLGPDLATRQGTPGRAAANPPRAWVCVPGEGRAPAGRPAPLASLVAGHWTPEVPSGVAGGRTTAMLTDLAALTPPLVMAAAFITGVVVLLRREMAPRRRGRIDRPEDSDSVNGSHGEMASPVFTQARGGRQNGDGEQASGNNSARNHAAGSGMRDLRGRGDDGDIRRAEDQPPAPPKV